MPPRPPCFFEHPECIACATTGYADVATKAPCVACDGRGWCLCAECRTYQDAQIVAWDTLHREAEAFLRHHMIFNDAALLCCLAELVARARRAGCPDQLAGQLRRALREVPGLRQRLQQVRGRYRL